MSSSSENTGSNCSSRSSGTSSPQALSPSSANNISNGGGILSTQQQQPFYFGNNNFHQPFQSGKGNFPALNSPEEDTRWFEAFKYFQKIKPEPLELNPAFQTFQNTPAHFYQQQYQSSFPSAPPQFYFHTQNIIQNNINNRVQTIFANDANVHQDDNNTLVNLALPGQLQASMESRSQVDSYYYSATSNGNRHGLHQHQQGENAQHSGHDTSKERHGRSSEAQHSDVNPQMDSSTKMIDDENTNEL